MMLGNDETTATGLLESAFALNRDPSTDRFVAKYVYGRVELSIAPGVTAELPINRDAVGLALAELKQKAGDADQAIGVVEQLEPTGYAAVSLAELYSQVGRHADVVEMTDGITNEDDASALLLVYRAVALREQRFNDAAHEAFKAALKSRSRAPAIRHLALSERARNYETQGKNGMARKDLERVLAEDSDFDGLQERLSGLSG
jgi:tetratricopeptide (TPR) repeat protein